MKKSTLILLIILGLALIGGAFWFYFNTKNQVAININIAGEVELQRVNKVKETAVSNVIDFLKTPKSPGSIWEDILAQKQFKNLQELKVDISLEGAGNSRPFDTPAPVEAAAE